MIKYQNNAEGVFIDSLEYNPLVSCHSPSSDRSLEKLIIPSPTEKDVTLYSIAVEEERTVPEGNGGYVRMPLNKDCCITVCFTSL